MLISLPQHIVSMREGFEIDLSPTDHVRAVLHNLDHSSVDIPFYTVHVDEQGNITVEWVLKESDEWEQLLRRAVAELTLLQQLRGLFGGL